MLRPGERQDGHLGDIKRKSRTTHMIHVLGRKEYHAFGIHASRERGTWSWINNINNSDWKRN